jgi:hypothetical protein
MRELAADTARREAISDEASLEDTMWHVFEHRH